MRNFKRAIALLIVLVMTVSMLPLSVLAETVYFAADSITAAVGTTVRLYACYEGSNSLVYSSDDEAVAVCYDREVSIVGEGTAVITADDGNGNTATIEIVAVSVEKIAEVIELDEVKYLDVAVDNAGVAVYSFTAPEAGVYEFYSMNNSYADPYAYLYDSEMKYIDHSDDDGGGFNYEIHYEMAAGETVYLNTQLYDVACEYEGTYEVSVRKLVPAESVTILSDITSMYVGEEVYLNIGFSPDNYINEVYTFSTSDSSIISVAYDSIYAESVGTATITVTTDNGLTDSVTIEVTERPAAESITITNMGNTDVYVGDYDWLDYELYPEDSAESVTWSSDNETVAIVSEYGDVDFLSAGTVTITVTTESGLTDSVTYTVSERPVAESIEIQNGDSLLYVGQSIDLYYYFSPDNAVYENVIWSSDNEAVATVDEYGYVEGVSEGIATITVTSENGLTDSVTVTVKVPSAIKLDETVVLTSETNGQGMFEFVPEEDGIYAFYSFDNDYDTFGYIYDADMNELGYNDDGGEGYNFRLEYALTAGETYYLYSRPYSVSNGSNSAEQYSVKVVKLVPATGISFAEDEIDVYAGNGFYVSVTFAPENAIAEEVYYESDNPDVLWVDSDGWCEPNAAGTAKVTATTESGLTATITINVIEPPAIVLNEPNEITFTETVYVHYFTFTPEATDAYFVKIDTDYDYAVVFEDENGNYIGDIYGGSDYVSLEAGVTYKVSVYANGEYSIGNTYTFVIAEDAYKNVELLQAPTKEYILGDGVFSNDNGDGTFDVYPADLQGIKIRVTNFDGTTEILTYEDATTFMLQLGGISYDIDSFTAGSAGTYETILYFAGYEFTYDVTVIENTVENVELVKGPDVADYMDYVYPRYDGIQLLITYKDGSSETITLTEDDIVYEVMNGILARAQFDGIEIFIITNVGSNAYAEYTPEAFLLCNGIELDITGEITYDDELYAVDGEVTLFTEDGDGLKLDVVLNDGTELSLELDALLTEVYGGGVSGCAMTDIGIAVYEIWEADGIYYIWILGTEFEVPATATYLLGDVNGDGKLTNVDYIMLKRIVMGALSTSELKNPETADARCDLSGDGKLRAADYYMLKREILGLN